MSSLIERLVIPEEFGGKLTPDNTHVRDISFDRHFVRLFAKLPPDAQPYLLRIISVSKIVIDEYKLLEMRKMAMKFYLYDSLEKNEFAQLTTRRLNTILQNVNSQNISTRTKGRRVIQKHHLVARSHAKAKYPSSESWVNQDFNISYVQDDIHAAIHGVIDNMSLEDAEIFLQLFNQPGMIWTRGAIAQSRIQALIQGTERREYTIHLNRKKAEEGKKRSAKK